MSPAIAQPPSLIESEPIVLERVLRLLQEYSPKLYDVSLGLAHSLALRRPIDLEAKIFEVAGLVCITEVLIQRLEPIAQYASEFLEHGRFEHAVQLELHLRVHEAEELLRFCKLQMQSVGKHVNAHGLRKQFNQIIEDSGRVKAPV